MYLTAVNNNTEGEDEKNSDVHISLTAKEGRKCTSSSLSHSSSGGCSRHFFFLASHFTHSRSSRSLLSWGAQDWIQQCRYTHLSGAEWKGRIISWPAGTAAPKAPQGTLGLPGHKGTHWEQLCHWCPLLQNIYKGTRTGSTSPSCISSEYLGECWWRTPVWLKHIFTRGKWRRFIAKMGTGF